jgi:hypothetical protein
VKAIAGRNRRFFFTKDEVHAFLKEANDETYLMLKVQEKNY